MKRSPFKSIVNHLPQVVLVVSLLGSYLSAIAPGLTWANGGSDGGDLITAAATGGIAHPTGYPLYLLLARLFQVLPVGSVAFRTNLMSALVTALAAGLVYSIVTASIPAAKPHQTWPAGLAAGFAFGLSPLVWSQALITEVYALQGFLVLWILYLYTRPVDQASTSDLARLSRWRGLALGLAMGNHLTTLFLLPIALLIGSIRTTSPDPSLRGGARPDEAISQHFSRDCFGKDTLAKTEVRELILLQTLKIDAALLRAQLMGFGMGLCLYLLIPLRALFHPPVNWGNAVTPERLWWLVSGRTYQGYYLQFTLTGVWDRMQAGAALVWEQFGLPGLALGLIGLVVYGTRSRLYAMTLWIAAAALAFVLVYRSEDAQVYLIPMFIAFAIWIGLGLAGLDQVLAPRYSLLGLSLGLLLAAYFLGRSLVYGRQVDASNDLRAEAFGREVLSAVPPNAMIFAEGDQAVFALWYFHFALGERPDLAVMASDLLHFDWYQETLVYTYPSLAVPGPFPWPESMAAANPARPACSVEYTGKTEIHCTQPLTVR